MRKPVSPKVALAVFKHQFQTNRVYRSFCDLINVHPSDVQKVSDIPFLPIQFFKSRKVLASRDEAQEVFTSSGTTGTSNKQAFCYRHQAYTKKVIEKGFIIFMGTLKHIPFWHCCPTISNGKGLLWSIWWRILLQDPTHVESGFYLDNLEELTQKLIALDKKGRKVLLIGVSFALLDLIEKQQFNLKNTTVMETGGMKGRRKELVREELHTILREGFGVAEIHSEYGMTELLSQGYSKGKGIFKTPPWMQVLTRDTEDALTINSFGKNGGINVIDLANYNSCSFIATQDLGKVHKDGTFEIIGRFDNSDIRGCNLMVL